MPKPPAAALRPARTGHPYAAEQAAGRAARTPHRRPRGPGRPRDASGPYALLYRHDLPEDTCRQIHRALRAVGAPQQWSLVRACALACAAPALAPALAPGVGPASGLWAPPKFAPLMEALCSATRRRGTATYAAVAAALIAAEDPIAARQSLLRAVDAASPAELTALAESAPWLRLVPSAQLRAQLIGMLINSQDLGAKDYEPLLRLAVPLLLDRDAAKSATSSPTTTTTPCRPTPSATASWRR